MPLYEYFCAGCGKTFEVIQKVSDDPLTECGSCGGQIERLLSAPAIQFKGAGWYVTDYSGKTRAGQKEGGEGTSKDGEGTSTKGEKSKDADISSTTGEAKK